MYFNVMALCPTYSCVGTYTHTIQVLPVKPFSPPTLSSSHLILHRLPASKMILPFSIHTFCSPYHSVQDLHRGVEIQAANGKHMLAIKVFAHALRFFKKHCLQELSDQSATRILNDDIRWVITVPAIWQQPAKQFMRAAAYDVSLGPRSYMYTL